MYHHRSSQRTMNPAKGYKLACMPSTICCSAYEFITLQLRGFKAELEINIQSTSRDRLKYVINTEPLRKIFSQYSISLYSSSPGCPGICSIDQAGFKFKRSACLCLPSFGIKDMGRHAWLRKENF